MADSDSFGGCSQHESCQCFACVSQIIGDVYTYKGKPVCRECNAGCRSMDRKLSPEEKIEAPTGKKAVVVHM